MMKVAIVFYSFSGNTKRIAEYLKEYLEGKKYFVKIFALKPKDESKKFIGQAVRAFWHTMAELEEKDYNLADFDIVCFGTPVWAFAPAPAMNTYLKNVKGLENKIAVLFTSYGSGVGNKRCINYMEKILRKKGIKDIYSFSIQEAKVFDKDFVYSEFKKLSCF